MKKMLKRAIALSLILAMILLCIPAQAVNAPADSCNVLFESFDETTHTGKQLASIEDSIFYTMATPEFTYCAQMTQAGKIQFSYMDLRTGSITESIIYDVNDICNTFNITKAKSNAFYEQLNTTISDNITSFSKAATYHPSAAHAEITAVNGTSNLNDAINSAFGSSYGAKLMGSSSKTHNGKTYQVRCTESQLNSHTAPESWAIAKDTAISAIVALVIAGSWSWVGAVASIVKSVVSTALKNGIYYTIKNFTAERSDATLLRNRTVTVTGYEGTQYWAGWTRKMYFFKGDLGWTHDANFHYDFQQSDYSDVLYLLDKGWQNFVEYTL